MVFMCGSGEALACKSPGFPSKSQMSKAERKEGEPWPITELQCLPLAHQPGTFRRGNWSLQRTSTEYYSRPTKVAVVVITACTIHIAIVLAAVLAAVLAQGKNPPSIALAAHLSHSRPHCRSKLL